MAGSQEELRLLDTITTLYTSISQLPSLSPCNEVNDLFTKLVHACIPPSTIDVAGLPDDALAMRGRLIALCGKAEGLLESHYSDLLLAQELPLESLELFPYYDNYIQLTRLEFGLLSQHVTAPPSHVAFLGSGPLPLSTLILATRYLPDAGFVNYDLDPTANERAWKLVRSDPDLVDRVRFQTEDIMRVNRAFSRYDVVFLAALVGMAAEEKRGVVEHLARHMVPGALLVVRSAHGARAFLYPVVEQEDLRGFDVLSVHHPGDEVINSVIVARKKRVVMPCKCCEPLVGHGSLGEELAVEGSTLLNGEWA